MHKNNLKVSIILPTFNGYRYLRESIESCLNQTYPNIELIIVDDGSSNKTKKIISSLKDSRIKVITLKKNQGLANALNIGFAKAEGDYLTWTSDDNYYHKEAITKMVSFLQEKKADFVYCDYYHFKNDDNSKLILVKLKDSVDLTKENGIGACFLYSKRVKKKVGRYDTNLPLVEDYDYWLRVCRKFKLLHLNKPLYYFRRHSRSLTAKYSQSPKLEKAIQKVKIKNKLVKEKEETGIITKLIRKLHK